MPRKCKISAKIVLSNRKYNEKQTILIQSKANNVKRNDGAPNTGCTVIPIFLLTLQIP